MITTRPETRRDVLNHTRFITIMIFFIVVQCFHVEFNLQHIDIVICHKMIFAGGHLDFSNFWPITVLPILRNFRVLAESTFYR